MDTRKARVLLIDDDDDSEVITRGMLSAVEGAAIDLEWVGTYDEGLAAIRGREYDAYLVDYRLGAQDGIELIRIAVKEGCRSPLILMTGQGEHSVDIQAMREGATDFLVKGRFNGVDIERSIRYAIERVRAAEEHEKHTAELELLSQQLPLIVWTTDEHLRFTSGWGAGLQKLGLLPDQLKGGLIQDYFKSTEGNGLTSDEAQELIEPHYRALKGESVSYQSNWMGRKYQVQVKPLWHNGHITNRPRNLIGTVGIALDVTDAKQIEEEVTSARTVQVGLLPKESPQIPGYDIAGVCRPTSATGGDYFDYIEMADESWGIMVADVSGHGFASALITMEVRRLIRTLVRWGAGLDDILSAANHAACEHPEVDRKFITLFFACLKPAARSFTYSAAGHQGFVLDRVGRVTRLKASALPLGMVDGEKFPRNGPVLLNPGDIFLLFTDGIDETFDSDGMTKYGIPRLLELVQAERHRPAADIVEIVIQDVLKYCDPAPPHDDLTLVVLKVDAAPSE